MRCAGKTILVHQLRCERLERGMPREHVPYLDFEGEWLADANLDAYTAVVKQVRTSPCTSQAAF
jgi:hypothetical protein